MLSMREGKNSHTNWLLLQLQRSVQPINSTASCNSCESSGCLIYQALKSIEYTVASKPQHRRKICCAHATSPANFLRDRLRRLYFQYDVTGVWVRCPKVWNVPWLISAKSLAPASFSAAVPVTLSCDDQKNEHRPQGMALVSRAIASVAVLTGWYWRASLR